MKRASDSGKWKASMLEKIALKVALRGLTGSLLVVAPNFLRRSKLLSTAKELAPGLDVDGATQADGITGVTKAFANPPDVCFMAQQADYSVLAAKRALESKGVKVFLFAWDSDVRVHSEAHLLTQ